MRFGGAFAREVNNSSKPVFLRASITMMMMVKTVRTVTTIIITIIIRTIIIM